MRDIKSELTAGNAVFGLMVTEIRTPSLGMIFDAANADFVIIDMEHGTFDYDTVAGMVMSCRHTQVAPFIRVPEIRREHFTKALDMGASGVLVPGVETRADAECCVGYCRYAPDGTRGVSLLKPHTEFRKPDRVEYTASANKRVMLMIQIETETGMRNIDDILSVPGLDLVFIGPSDLAHSLTPQSNRNETSILHRAFHQVVDAGLRHGVKVGIHTSSFDTAATLLDKGVQLISVSSDIAMLISQSQNIIKQFRSAVPEKGVQTHG